MAGGIDDDIMNVLILNLRGMTRDDAGIFKSCDDGMKGFIDEMEKFPYSHVWNTFAGYISNTLGIGFEQADIAVCQFICKIMNHEIVRDEPKKYRLPRAWALMEDQQDYDLFIGELWFHIRMLEGNNDIKKRLMRFEIRISIP